MWNFISESDISLPTAVTCCSQFACVWPIGHSFWDDDFKQLVCLVLWFGNVATLTKAYKLEFPPPTACVVLKYWLVAALFSTKVLFWLIWFLLCNFFIYTPLTTEVLKSFSLLRQSVWLISSGIKQKCNADFVVLNIPAQWQTAKQSDRLSNGKCFGVCSSAHTPINLKAVCQSSVWTVSP